MTWREREAIRFHEGEYQRVPWNREEWWRSSQAFVDHYAHVSTDDPSKLAYTPDDRFGEEDRQLRTKPGRYLTKFFSEVLTPNEIQMWAGRWAGSNEDIILRWAWDPEEIALTYMDGPNSCMQRDNWDTPDRHPTRVYGAGDLAVAYIKDGERITARSVCWPDKKIYNVIYGDSFRLEPQLSAAGYREDSGDEFEGAKLLYVESDYGYPVAPWMDGDYGGEVVVEEGTKYLKICTCCNNLHSTSGYIGGETCDSCGGVRSEDEGYYISDIEEYWCENCYCEGAMYCDHCHETVRSEDSGDVGGEGWCEYCTSHHSFMCEDCCERFPDDDVFVWKDNLDLCEDCYDSRKGDEDEEEEDSES
jgi:hypothetical protein